MKYRINVYEEQVYGFTIEASSEEEASRLAAEFWDDLDAQCRDTFWEDSNTDEMTVVREDPDARSFVRRDSHGDLIPVTEGAPC